MLCRLTTCLPSARRYIKVLASAAPLADQHGFAAAVHALHSSAVAELVVALEPSGGSLRTAQGACWRKAISLLVSRALPSPVGHCTVSAWQLRTACRPRRPICLAHSRLCTAMQGKKVLIMEDACCSSGGEPVIDGFEYDFSPRERVGIVGPNGAG